MDRLRPKKVLKRLGLHYPRDTAVQAPIWVFFAQKKKKEKPYDIEGVAWPGQNCLPRNSSCSNCGRIPGAGA